MDSRTTPARDEYLVVWDGTDERPGNPSRWDCEVYGQRLDGAGNPIGEDDFQISSMFAPESGSACGPRDPRVVQQPANGEYLVVWWGRQPLEPYPEHIDGAWGQRLGPAGGKLGGPVLLTDPSQREGYTGDVVAIGLDGEYLLAWQEDYPDAIHGRRVDAALRPLGPELSVFPPPVYTVGWPVLSCDPWRRHYVAAVGIGYDSPRWQEIFAVPLDVTGTPIAEPIQVSETPDPSPDDPLHGPVQPTGQAIAPVPPDGEHVVVWAGGDPEPPVESMREIGSRRLRDRSPGIAPPRWQAVGGSPSALARRTIGSPVRLSRLSPGGGVLVYERAARRRTLRPLRRRELIGVVVCNRSRACRVRLVTHPPRPSRHTQAHGRSRRGQARVPRAQPAPARRPPPRAASAREDHAARRHPLAHHDHARAKVAATRLWHRGEAQLSRTGVSPAARQRRNHRRVVPIHEKWRGCDERDHP